MTNPVTKEYLDDFANQDGRTAEDFRKIGLPRYNVYEIEAGAIRDFDTYILHSGARLLTGNQWALAKQWLGTILEIEEDGLMDDLQFYDDPTNAENGMPTTKDILEQINAIRELMGLRKAYIHRNYPFAATRHDPGGAISWAEPRDTLRYVGDPDPTLEGIRLNVESVFEAAKRRD